MNKRVLAYVSFSIAFFAVWAFILLPQAPSASNITVLWPEEGVYLEGEYVFKAYIPNKPLQSYKMYVSDGNDVRQEMDDSFEEIPHKEARVTVANPPVNFIAVDTATLEEIDRKKVSVKTARTWVSRLFAADTAPSINWVTEGQSASGTHTFSVSVEGGKPADYYMFWQTGSTAYTRMHPKNGEDMQTHANINFTSWTWKQNGPYDIKFILQDKNGVELGRKSVSVLRRTINGASVMATASYVSPTPTPVPTPTPPPPTSVSTSTPTSTPPVTVPTQPQPVTRNSKPSFSGKGLYVHPSKAATVARDLVVRDKTAGKMMEFISDEAQAVWLVNGSAAEIALVKDIMSKSKSAGKIPSFVLYALPQRDCGSESAGGVSNADAYKAWTTELSSAFGSGNALVIVEPDGLARTECLSPSQLTERFDLIKDAVKKFNNNSGTRTYIDIGHPYWLSVTDASDRLKKAGVELSQGFSLNISNFISTNDNILYGEQIVNRIGDVGFVVDTSRNGNGPTATNEWCNPSGRSLGYAPSLTTGNVLADAFLWIKHPGESDGACNGGPSAGEWWTFQAFDYIANTLKAIPEKYRN